MPPRRVFVQLAKIVNQQLHMSAPELAFALPEEPWIVTVNEFVMGCYSDDMEPDQRPPGMLENCRIMDATTLRHITDVSAFEDGKQYILCVTPQDFEAILRKHGLPVPGEANGHANGGDERPSIATTDQLESLEELSYYFDELGTLRHCATNQTVNEIMSDQSRAGEIDEIVKAAIFHIQMEMLAELSFKQAHLPLDIRPDEPKEMRSSVFLTSDWKSNNNLLIVINGSRGVQPGIWSRDLLIQEGVELGSMIPVCQKAQSNGFSVVVLNPFTNNYTIGNDVRPIRHNSTSDEHTLYVWDHIISRSLAKNVYILAYSAGAKCVTTLIQNREAEVVKRLKGVVLAESTYRIDPSSTSPLVGQFLRQRAIHFKADDKIAMGSQIHQGDDMPATCLSVGPISASADSTLSRKVSSNKARTVSLCQDMAFKYFIAVRDRGCAAPQYIAESTSKSRSLIPRQFRTLSESIRTVKQGRRMSTMPDGPPPKNARRDSMAGTSAMRASILSTGGGSAAVSVSDFDLIKVIGKGSIGKVFLVRKIDTHEIYAMKVLRKKNVVRRGLEEHIKTERLILEEIDHPFIARLRFSFQTADKLYLVTDFCSGGELFQHMNGAFSYDLSLFYAAELVLALEHLHSRKVAYRDLKPENILLEASGHLRITDFGLSKQDVVADDGARTLVGSPEYLAPEVLDFQKYGFAVDWWSLGVFLYEMLVGEHPFWDDNRQIMQRNISTPGFIQRKMPPAMPQEAASLIAGLLEHNPSKRLGSRGTHELRNHPFFVNINWDKLLRREIEPPWRPTVQSELDVGNFDPEFTSQDVVDSVLTHQSVLLNTTFDNFSFNPTASMRNR